MWPYFIVPFEGHIKQVVWLYFKTNIGKELGYWYLSPVTYLSVLDSMQLPVNSVVSGSTRVIGITKHSANLG
jgi:hypothetical protein